MAYARPLIATPKRRTIAMPGQFKTLKGQKIKHHAGGYWSPKALYKIIDKRSANSDYSNFIWLARCSRCETVQHIEARALRRGIGCKVCKKADKRTREAALRDASEADKQTKREKLVEFDVKIRTLIAAGLSPSAIARALEVPRHRIITRMHLNNLRSVHVKRTKGMTITKAGTAVFLTDEDRKQKHRVASRKARGLPKELWDAEGKLRSGPRGPRVKPEDRSKSLARYYENPAYRKSVKARAKAWREAKKKHKVSL